MKANKLKVTDLMVGDWVSCQINGIEVKYVRIASLNKTTMNGIPTDFIEFNKVMVDMLHGNYYQVDIASVHPILLTTEILEKNGFEWIKNKIVDEAYVLTKTFWDEEPELIIRRFDFNESFVICTSWDDTSFMSIGYVHELQHLLKLCDIDKEIVI